MCSALSMACHGKNPKRTFWPTQYIPINLNEIKLNSQLLAHGHAGHTERDGASWRCWGCCAGPVAPGHVHEPGLYCSTEGNLSGNCEFQAQRSTDICTLPRVKHSSWEAAVEHSGLSAMLCDDLEGQDGGGAREGGDICTHGADS